MDARFSMVVAAMWAVGCAAQAGAGATDLAEGGDLGDPAGATAPADTAPTTDMAPWGAAGGAADAPVEDETPASSASAPSTSTAGAPSSASSGTESTPDTSGAGQATPSTSTTPPASGTSTTPPASQPPPLFPASDPDRTPSPENIAECPEEAPADPWGPCIGVPVYATCKYGTTYSCLCDWIHWICVG